MTKMKFGDYNGHNNERFCVDLHRSNSSTAMYKLFRLSCVFIFDVQNFIYLSAFYIYCNTHTHTHMHTQIYIYIYIIHETYVYYGFVKCVLSLLLPLVHCNDENFRTSPHMSEVLNRHNEIRIAPFDS